MRRVNFVVPNGVVFDVEFLANEDGSPMTDENGKRMFKFNDKQLALMNEILAELRLGRITNPIPVLCNVCRVTELVVRSGNFRVSLFSSLSVLIQNLGLSSGE